MAATPAAWLQSVAEAIIRSGTSWPRTSRYPAKQARQHRTRSCGEAPDVRWADRPWPVGPSVRGAMGSVGDRQPAGMTEHVALALLTLALSARLGQRNFV